MSLYYKKRTQVSEWLNQNLKRILFLEEGQKQNKTKKPNLEYNMYIQNFYFKTKNHSNNNRKSIWKYSQSGHWEMGKLPQCITANPQFLKSQK